MEKMFRLMRGCKKNAHLRKNLDDYEVNDSSFLSCHLSNYGH